MENERNTEELTFNLREAADELISNETESDSPEASASEGQANTAPTETVSEEQKALDILEGKEPLEVKPADDNELIEKINGLGAIHNGLGISITSKEQLKELIQKGYDYTKKTMSHAEEVKQRQEEFAKIEASYKEKEEGFSKREQELHAISIQNEIVNAMVDKWKETDIDLYNYIQSAYQTEVNAYQKQQPIISKYEDRFKQFEDKFSQLEKEKQSSHLGEIKKNFDAEMASVQETRGARLKELGIVPNWDKVKEIYAADATNKMTVEQALLAVHGSDMVKMAESRMNALKAKNKVQSSKLNRTGVGSRQSGETEVTAKKAGDYMSILSQAAEQLT